MMTLSKFGSKLKNLIKSTGLSQREFSAKLGVNDSAMSRYIKGEREPRVDLLWKISKAFNVSLDYFNDKEVNNFPLPSIKEIVCRNGKNLSESERLELIKILSEGIVDHD